MYQFWADMNIRQIRISVSFFCLSDKNIIFLFFFLNRYPDRISNFHIFNPTQISMFLDIHHLFTSWISTNPNIKNFKICLSILLGASPFGGGAKDLQKVTSFFKKGIFCCKYFLKIKIKKS